MTKLYTLSNKEDNTLLAVFKSENEVRRYLDQHHPAKLFIKFKQEDINFIENNRPVRDELEKANRLGVGKVVLEEWDDFDGYTKTNNNFDVDHIYPGFLTDDVNVAENIKEIFEYKNLYQLPDETWVVNDDVDGLKQQGSEVYNKYYKKRHGLAELY